MYQALKDKHLMRIVVEHSDRLTHFGLNYLNLWMGNLSHAHFTSSNPHNYYELLKHHRQQDTILLLLL